MSGGRGALDVQYERSVAGVKMTSCNRPFLSFHKIYLRNRRDADGDGAALVVGHTSDHDDLIALLDVAV